MAEKPVPTPTPTTRPFWDGASEGELRIQHCAACGRHVFYPRIACPHCGSAELAWVRASGRAMLYSYIISHQSAPGFEDEVPFIIAIVQLEEGPRMLTNIVGIEPDPELLVLDMPLEVVFQPRGDLAIPLFRPIAETPR